MLFFNRYMSPEVANREHYNQGCDVFSFGIVLYEILSLNQPDVIEGRRTSDPMHFRICPCWPQSIAELMIQSWSPSISQRPTMSEAGCVLRNYLLHLQGTAKVRSPQGNDVSLDISLVDGMGLNKRSSRLQIDEMSIGTASMRSMSLQL